MVGCQKQSTVHKVQAIGHQDLDDRYSLFINNGEFIVDLKSGKIKNDNDEVIGSVLLGHADKKTIGRLFMAGSINAIMGEYHVSYHKTDLLTSNDIIIVNKYSISQSFLYLRKNIDIHDVTDEKDRNIMSLYNCIMNVLNKNKNYKMLYKKSKKENTSLYL